ncbi:MAG: GerMN domain-containing protein [Actinomycetia bacterium]|nr:GerMN domain-containing protein [Actinomycetes bacterium]
MTFDDQVRDELHRQADQVEPQDRLAQILARGAAGEEPLAPVVPMRQARRRSRPAAWLSVAAVVLAVAVGSVVGLRLLPLAGSAPARSEAGSPLDRSEASEGAVAQSAGWQVPVYYLTTGGTGQSWLLGRDSIRVPAPADLSARARLAVSTLVTGMFQGARLPYANWQQPWPEGTQAEVVVSPSLIQVSLSQPPRAGLTAEQLRMAYQSVVWTATEAAELAVPVQIQAGGTVLTTASRPPAADQERDLAPVWVLQPSRWASVPAGQPVFVRGEACTSEAGLAWRLLQSGQVVQSGQVAGVGCPPRSPYEFTIASLPKGEYVLQVQLVGTTVSARPYQDQITLTVV